MKWFVNFLENNSKWLVRILVFIWLFLIIKLWWFGLDFKFHIFEWYIDYWWTNAWYIAIAFLLISSIWIYIISKTKNKILKVKIAFLIFILWVIWKSVFYVVSPDFRFYMTNVEREYSDKNWNITDMDLYLEYMSKYCDNSIDDFKFMRVYREDLCWWQYLYDFKTVEEYWIVFDYANKYNLGTLYRLTYAWAEDFWLEKIIKWYNDDTFQAYMLMKWELDKEKRNFLSDFITNTEIKKVLEYYENSILENKKLSSSDNNHDGYVYWNNFNKELYKKLKGISEINYKIF